MEETTYASSGRTFKGAVAVALIASLFAITKMECAKPRQPALGDNNDRPQDSVALIHKAQADYLATHFRFP